MKPYPVFEDHTVHPIQGHANVETFKCEGCKLNYPFGHADWTIGTYEADQILFDSLGERYVSVDLCREGKLHPPKGHGIGGYVTLVSLISFISTEKTKRMLLELGVVTQDRIDALAAVDAIAKE